MIFEIKRKIEKKMFEIHTRAKKKSLEFDVWKNVNFVNNRVPFSILS